jgi:hypothetical protein
MGSVEMIMSELLSTAAQAEVDGQETAVTGSPEPAVAALHMPPAGSIEVKIWPALPVTQSDGDGQEIPLRLPVPAGVLTSLHATAPPVGLVELTMLPLLSTATQSEGEAQETPRRSSGSDSLAIVHALAPPVGLVEVTIFPL